MSLLTTLGKFGGSLIPGIGPLVSAGFGALDLLHGPSTAQSGTQDTLTENAKTAQGLSSSLTKNGIDTTGTAGNYFSSILGNREQALASADPEITTIMDQFDKAHKAAAEFAPRGGGRATLNAQQPYAQAGIIGKILAGKRDNAASSLSTLGLNETGMGINSLNAGTTAAAHLGENELGYQKMKGAEFGGIGKGIGDFLGTMLTKPKGGSGDGGD